MHWSLLFEYQIGSHASISLGIRRTYTAVKMQWEYFKLNENYIHTDSQRVCYKNRFEPCGATRLFHKYEYCKILHSNEINNSNTWNEWRFLNESFEGNCRFCAVPSQVLQTISRKDCLKKYKYKQYIVL